LYEGETASLGPHQMGNEMSEQAVFYIPANTV